MSVRFRTQRRLPTGGKRARSALTGLSRVLRDYGCRDNRTYSCVRPHTGVSGATPMSGRALIENRLYAPRTHVYGGVNVWG
jgi:hypothetical protein